MGCLFLILIGVSPRLGVVALWLLTPLVSDAFRGWLIPVLGIIFLPWTTAFYVVGYWLGDGAAAPWGILGIIIGLFLDIALHAGSATMGRRRYSTT